MVRVVVKPGDCISSIAERHGHFWKTVWGHADNSDLRHLRRDPNVLLAGDVVAVPELTAKQETRPPEARHKFRRLGVPGLFRLRLLKDGEPRANLDYTLVVDGRSIAGRTDADGFLEVALPPTARRGSLRIRDGKREEVHPLTFGGLDPLDTAEGVEQRLAQLGYRGADAPGEAIRAFQRVEGLTPSGTADEATRARLKEVYGQ